MPVCGPAAGAERLAAVGRVKSRAAWCTGTLVTPRHVLTAAHCLSAEVDGTVFEEEMAVDFVVHEAVRQWHHPELDVGVVELAADVPDVMPLGLWPSSVEDLLGRTVVQVGYGDPSHPDLLEGKAVNERTDVRIAAVSGPMFTAMPGHCWSGDSGGPAVWEPAEHGISIVVGVLHASDPSGGCPPGNSRADSYTAVADATYEWIVGAIRESLPDFVFDADRDGVPDQEDSCPGIPNADAVEPLPDTDGDTLPDLCDTCPGAPNAGVEQRIDHDSDTFPDACDNCPTVVNAGQENCDAAYDPDPAFHPGASPHRGDACDPDPCIEFIHGAGSPVGGPDEHGIFRPSHGITVFPGDGTFHAEVGADVAYGFRSIGGWRHPDGVDDPDLWRTTMYYPADVPVRTAWCSCEPYPGGDEERDTQCLADRTLGCARDGIWRQDDRYRRGWFRQARRLEGRVADGDLTPDLTARFGHRDHIGGVWWDGSGRVTGLNRVVWAWSEESCPNPAHDGTPDSSPAIRCGDTPGGQHLQVWLRPLATAPGLVNGWPVPWAWPESLWSWPEDRYNYYPNESSIALRSFSFGGRGAIEWHKPQVRRFAPAIDCPQCVRLDERIPVLSVFERGCPLPPDSPFRFADLPPDAPVLGIAIGLHDYDAGRTLSAVPTGALQPGLVPALGGAAYAAALSRSGPSDPPGLGLAAIDGSGQAGEWRIWSFGGEDGDGVLSDELWTAEPDPTRTGPDAGYVWRRLDVEGDRPSPRRDAALVADAARGRLWLFGGSGAQGPLSDVWSIEVGSRAWVREVPVGPDRPAGRSGMVAAQSGGVVYLVGGETSEGPSSDILAWHASTRTMRILDRSGPARAFASAAVDGDGRLWLHGGHDGSAWRNDLWTFDPRARSWERRLDDCRGAGCPPAAPGTALLADPNAGQVTLYPGRGAVAEASPSVWLAAPEFGQGWTPVTSTGVDDDCDGDTVRDPGGGEACRLGAEWYAPVGRRACDGTSASLGCAANVWADVVRRQWSGAGTTAFALVGERHVAAVRGAWLTVLESDGGRLSETARHRTFGAARDAVAAGRWLSLAVPVGIEVVDVAVPDVPRRHRLIPLHPGPWEVDRWGDRVVAVTSFGPHVVDLATGVVRPPIPASCGSGGCGAATFRPETRLAVAGGTAYLADGSMISAWRLTVDGAVGPLSCLDVGGPVSAIRALGDRVYLTGGRHDALRLVLDASDPEAALVPAGTHDLADWVAGAEWRGDVAYRLAAHRGIETAEVR